MSKITQCAGMALTIFAAACGVLSSNGLPRDIRDRRVADTLISVAQLDAYYGGAPTTRWRDLNDGRYGLDVTDSDPLTNEPRTINFLFAAVPATRQFPEYRMSITDMALNGDPLDYRAIRTALDTFAAQIAPAPPAPLSRRDRSPPSAENTPLRCSPRADATSRADFSLYTLNTLDTAFSATYGATRVERAGGALDDGTPFTYITYAGSTPTSITFAVATNSSGALEVFSERDFNAPAHANTPSYADTDWYAGEAMCDELAVLLQTHAGTPPLRRLPNLRLSRSTSPACPPSRTAQTTPPPGRR
ncbi:MAG: hypothetical protein M0D54_02370 [Hyphomonadaceae bacterium JAD_PAG50586_4]|nr:MAG: hypothetical protein M0D54_02370 [Hyphomonadaceae bacterium JAD_PAG50586_4]